MANYSHVCEFLLAIYFTLFYLFMWFFSASIHINTSNLGYFYVGRGKDSHGHELQYYQVT